jgi:hypothetical protein
MGLHPGLHPANRGGTNRASLPIVADVGRSSTVIRSSPVARTETQRADEDALDPVEAADVEHADDPDAGLLELDPEAEPDEEDEPDPEDDELDLSSDEPDDEGDEETPAALDGVEVDLDTEDVDDETVGGVVLPDAAFDDDEVAAVVVDIDDDDDEIEGVRDGEFVCRRCYMAMRETQLADAERLLCRDCA